MFPVHFSFNFGYAAGVVKGIYRGTTSCFKNIQKGKQPSSHGLCHRVPIRGEEVLTYGCVIKYLKSRDVSNVVVLAGAGISTSCGIPDFRTKGTGLYYNLQKYKLPYAEAVFDLDYFRKNQGPFFALAKELYPGRFRPGVAHYFIKLLHQKKKLLRMYTQNIDGLEKLAGIPAEKLVECHGTFETASCINCGMKYDGEQVKQSIFADIIPVCKKEGCRGIIKPDIIFFGEALPERFMLCMEDMKKIDLMIVMGTSLAVFPFSNVADMIPDSVPRLLINNEDPLNKHRNNDIFKQGNIDDVIQDLLASLGWSSDLQEIMNSNRRE